MQLVHHYSSDGWHELELPAADAPLPYLPEIVWGKPAQLFSPSFWRFQHWVEFELHPHLAPKCKLGGGSLLDEVIACLLGGYGLPAETSLAYFNHMKATGFLKMRPQKPEVVENFLREPVMVGTVRRRYRFWRTKARSIWAVMSKHRDEINELENSGAAPRLIRDRLTRLPGVGLKTASWICRNWFDNDDVAVLDIHIIRALAHLGYNVPSHLNPRNYHEAENQFLALSRSLGLSTRTLDLVMWAITRQLPTGRVRQELDF